MLKPTKMENYGYFTFHIGSNKGADQTARMRRLVCSFVARKPQSQGFSHQCPYGVEAQASWPPPGYAAAQAFHLDNKENSKRNNFLKIFI